MRDARVQKSVNTFGGSGAVKAFNAQGLGDQAALGVKPPRAPWTISTWAPLPQVVNSMGACSVWTTSLSPAMRSRTVCMSRR